jgi:carboxymethylenebutenolidase
MTEGTPEESRRMFEHMESLSNALVLSDTQALLELVEGEEAASSGPKGCIGYCMSGQFVMSVTGTFPEHFKAGVSCYGVRIVTDAEDSPHLLASKVAGELLFAFAETDPWVPDGVIDTLRSALDEHGVAHHIETYPGTAHGFCFPERAGAYDEASAEQVWKRSFELFARRLS